MQENKNLVQEALLQMKNVEEAIAQNAKGILASTIIGSSFIHPPSIQV